MQFLIFFLCFLSATHSIYGAVSNKEEEPRAVDNFALPTAQQITPLVSFGQTNIDKGQTQLFVHADYFKGKKKSTSDIVPYVIYGITNNLTATLNVPFTPLLRDGSFRSRGEEDVLLQLEYIFYTKNTYTSVDQATIVADVTFPTGSSKKKPPTGFGAPSYFIGGTYNHMTTDWFVFTSHGALLPTAHRETRFGEQFLYQFGFGGHIPSPKEWIYAWMMEFDGTYSWKNKIQSLRDPNSGGNVILMTPSLWASSERVVMQFGVGVPVVQHLFGDQRKYHYSLILNVGYTF